MARARFAGTAWAVLILAVGTAAVAAQDAVTLVRPAKKGDVARYKFEIKGKVGGADFAVTGISKEEITKVDEGGTAAILVTEEETKLTVMGMEQAQPASTPATYNRDRLGKVLEYKHDDPNPVFSPAVEHLLAQVSEPVLSSGAIKRAEGWDTELDNPAMPGTKIKLTTTYLGNEKIGDVEAWKLKQLSTAEVPNGTVRSEHTFWLDPRSGTLVVEESSVTDLPSAFGPTSWQFRRELVK